MKSLRISLTFFCVLALSALSAQAAQLASAKVLKVEGSVFKYTPDGANMALKAGDILTAGDSISATALSSAMLVFSNGSEVTVKENSSLNIAKLEQAAFGGNQSYEQLQADPSQSQALLELNYGELDFHVKKLRPGSSFDVQTPLGTAAVRGTTGTVKLVYNTERNEFLLIIINNDGLVDIISRYIGEFEYGQGNIGDKGYDSGTTDTKAEPIPRSHTVVIRLSADDPLFDTLFRLYQNYNPTGAKGPSPTPPPVFTPDPEDPGVIIVSPEGPAGPPMLVVPSGPYIPSPDLN